METTTSALDNYKQLPVACVRCCLDYASNEQMSDVSKHRREISAALHLLHFNLESNTDTMKRRLRFGDGGSFNAIK